MKRLWKAKNDKEGVSPVIATILMVAITVVLAAILMVIVMDMAGDADPPSAVITASSDGVTTTVIVTFISKPVSIYDVAVNVPGTTNPAWAGSPSMVSSGTVWTATGSGYGQTVYLMYDGNIVLASYTIPLAP